MAAEKAETEKKRITPNYVRKAKAEACNNAKIRTIIL